jgi:hypothetical protein
LEILICLLYRVFRFNLVPRIHFPFLNRMNVLSKEMNVFRTTGNIHFGLCTTWPDYVSHTYNTKHHSPYPVMEIVPNKALSLSLSLSCTTHPRPVCPATQPRTGRTVTPGQRPPSLHPLPLPALRHCGRSPHLAAVYGAACLTGVPGAAGKRRVRGVPGGGSRGRTGAAACSHSPDLGFKCRVSELQRH